MVGIPYVERRRQRLYLRVRVPADIALLSGKKFFVKSLETADLRQARAEAARLLAGLHAGWQAVRSGTGADDDMRVFPSPKAPSAYQGSPEEESAEGLTEQAVERVTIESAGFSRPGHVWPDLEKPA